MRLARLKSDPRFYQIVVGTELFPFQMIVTGDLRVSMPLDANEFLPAVAAMNARGSLAKHQARLERAAPEDFSSFRQPLDPADLDAPVRPPSFRDFCAFEAHMCSARCRPGLDMVPEWYDAPAFHYSNVTGILGPCDPVRKPKITEELDYELEIAAIIGMQGSDIPVEAADSFIAGYTLLNDWSARDLQRQEMRVGLGPAKGKDFATSIGPYLVTPDELAVRALPDRSRGLRYDLTMTAQVNGKQISRGNASKIRWTFAELIAYASRDTVLMPGDLIGSGAVGTGCLAEFPAGAYPWLQPGDVVRLEIDLLGTLETIVVD